MSTLSADIHTTPSTTTLPSSIFTITKKIARAIGKRLVAAAEVVYEARKEEVRLRTKYYM